MPAKPARLLFLVLVLILVLVGDWRYRRWHPTVTLTTDHYLIRSSASETQTKEIGEVVETLYRAYATLFSGWPEMGPAHESLQLRLFKDRREFRRCNRGLGWAEAFYREPSCYAYYSAVEIGPYHWMLHEAVHQLNREVIRLRAPPWVDEGLAAYFSTSRLKEGALQLGEIDRNAYPVWWLDDMDLSERSHERTSPTGKSSRCGRSSPARVGRTATAASTSTTSTGGA